MHWVTLFLVFALALQCHANQDLRTTILRQNLADKNVRLDPLLRKALLRALVELEKEAEEKLKAEETRSARSESANDVGNFFSNANENKREIQTTQESGFNNSPLNNPETNPQLFIDKAINNQVTTEGILSTTDSSVLQYSTLAPTETEANNPVEETMSANVAIHSNIDTNFISEDENRGKNAAEPLELNKEKKNEENTEVTKSEGSANEVDIFKAPLVAAFTLHQDSKGTPQSVIPLFQKEVQHQRQHVLEQQLAAFKQQQFLQNQFIPNVPITPVPQFDQSTRYFLPGTVNSGFSHTTVFPPLVSNSILSPTFTPSVIPSQPLHSSTVAPLPPQSNISPQSFAQALLPPQEFASVSVLPSHNINFPPSTSTNFHLPPVTPSGLQPINIPQVTLPLQNEGRFQSPIIVPSHQGNQGLLDNQEQERYKNRLLIEEQNRKRIIEEQNRQRFIQEQNRQRQLEEEKQKRLYEQQIQLRQQRQEHGVDFQRSVGFTFNQNLQSAFKSTNRNPNAYNFHIQPAQSFVSTVNFGNSDSQQRVNRQEGFGSTGNFGFSNYQGPRNYDNRNHFQSNQIYSSYSQPQEYRTIPEEHYRNTPINQYQQPNRFNSFGNNNNYRPNNVYDVNKRLQSLLYQSGVANDASRQEDLNIVSKVLALNHERSDVNADNRIVRNQRSVEDNSEKNIEVGEIKDISSTE